MALDATPGSESANSYVTVVEANAYFVTRPHKSGWDSLIDKENALISASRMLDWYMKWKGTKTTSIQAMEWPRAGVYEKNSYLIPNDIVPTRVKEAVCELLLFSISEDRVAENELDGFSALNVGPIKLQNDFTHVRTSKKKVIPSHVNMILSGLTNSSKIQRLVRG